MNSFTKEQMKLTEEDEEGKWCLYNEAGKLLGEVSAGQTVHLGRSHRKGEVDLNIQCVRVSRKQVHLTVLRDYILCKNIGMNAVNHYSEEQARLLLEPALTKQLDMISRTVEKDHVFQWKHNEVLEFNIANQLGAPVKIILGKSGKDINVHVSYQNTEFDDDEATVLDDAVSIGNNTEPSEGKRENEQKKRLQEPPAKVVKKAKTEKQKLKTEQPVRRTSAPDLMKFPAPLPSVQALMTPRPQQAQLPNLSYPKRQSISNFMHQQIGNKALDMRMPPAHLMGAMNNPVRPMKPQMWSPTNQVTINDLQLQQMLQLQQQLGQPHLMQPMVPPMHTGHIGGSNLFCPTPSLNPLGAQYHPPPRPTPVGNRMKMTSLLQAAAGVDRYPTMPLNTFMNPISRKELGQAKFATQFQHQAPQQARYITYKRKSPQGNGETISVQRSLKMSSKYRGVSKCSNDTKWQVRIRIGRTVKYIGRFDDEIQAALCYDMAAEKYHGDRAVFNFRPTKRLKK